MDNKKLYKDQRLSYSEDGRLLDEYGNSVMMEWERPIMKRSAEIITFNHGRVLNVGFGMGIIDSYIQELGVDEHWIIEPHLDVYTKMYNDGWHLKKNVKILFGDWQWYIQYLPKFDGVFFDTWEDNNSYFLSSVPNFLKDDGIFTLFNNPRDDEKGLHMNEDEYNNVSNWGTIDFEKMNIDFIDPPERQRTDGKFYWLPKWNTYYFPIIKKKK